MNKFLLTIILLVIAALFYLGMRPSPEESKPGTVDHHENAETFTREEVKHAFGTKPNTVFHPKTAINTDVPPSIAIKAGDESALHYYRVADNTYLFYGNIAEVDENNRGYNGNAGFVVTDDSVVVIDSLGTPALGLRMIKTIQSVTDKPIKYLIVTHNHPDHAYGAIAFKELGNVEIIGHQGTMDYIQSGRIEHSVNYRKTFIEADMKGFSPVVPSTLVNVNIFTPLRITTGGKTFAIYNTGSHHSYGDLIVQQVEDKIVWISDLAFNNRVTYMADGSSEKAINAQQWLLDNFGDSKLMIPGHGSAQTAPFPMVKQTQDYIKDLRQKVTEAINNDWELQETIDNTQFEQWKQTNLYELNQKKNVDFVYRELEDALF